MTSEAELFAFEVHRGASSASSARALCRRMKPLESAHRSPKLIPLLVVEPESEPSVADSLPEEPR